jgi:prophage regulatory protein
MEDSIKYTKPNSIQFYRLSQLKTRLNVSGSSIWAWAKAGKFPKPIKLSQNTTAWDAASVDKWCADRISASQGGGEQE